MCPRTCSLILISIAHTDILCLSAFLFALGLQPSYTFDILLPGWSSDSASANVISVSVSSSTMYSTVYDFGDVRVSLVSFFVTLGPIVFLRCPAIFQFFISKFSLSRGFQQYKNLGIYTFGQSDGICNLPHRSWVLNLISCAYTLVKHIYIHIYTDVPTSV